MKFKPFRYSSAVGEVFVMATFKVKYCHNVFDIVAVRELCDALINEAFQKYEIRCLKMAFDSNHVHMIIEMGLYGKPELAKKIRGYVGRQIFLYMPWMKKNKWEGGLFWGSGFWNPAYDIRNIDDLDFYMNYLDNQKYANKGQKQLASYK